MTLGPQIPRFRLTLLGRIDLATTNGSVRLPGNKPAGLLAYLAYTAPRPQPRERLANLLWGSHFEIQARQNLRHALFQLRRVLGVDAILSDDHDVQLAPGAFDCDVARFKALVSEGSPSSIAAAIDLYQHPLLTDLNIAEDAWSDWRDLERKQLEDLALNTMVSHGHQALQAGDADTALKSAGQAIRTNALREDAHRLMIHALAAQGRKAEALKYYRDLVTLLARELNTEPDPLTQAIVAELSEASPPGTPRAAGEPVRATPEASERPVETPSAVAPDNDPAPRAGAHADVLEQRQLTIMVCNLVGATGFSANRDPEDIVDLVTAFHNITTGLAARFDGSVSRYHGNAVAVYFGYPTAHEYDAERAVCAGLALIDAVGKLEASFGVKVQASVGIATGLVIVSEKPASDHRWHQVVIGETPDLATRLPEPAVLVTAPVVVMESAPSPSFRAKMPSFMPLTAAALIIRSVPWLLRAYMPSSVPVTAPLAVTASAPLPLLSA